jgi:EAL domain-containing protein (putative c-di-GMP-specific phosphodiesterase class I)
MTRDPRQKNDGLTDAQRLAQRKITTRSHLALESALSRDDLDVVFQPIVDLATTKTFALEALVRCKVPSLQPPPVLFEHAVKHEYCGRLGRLIREITVERCPGIPIFTNVHPGELAQRWLVRPDDPIFSHDSDVYIEITESVPFSHFDNCVSVLKEVRSRGRVHLVIDDLGSGFSNLKRIVDLQPKVVKLDIELVRGIDREPRQRALVRSIVAMCMGQGASVVAEGIETVDELSAVIDTGVHYGQGYLLARPAYPVPTVTWPKSIRPL